MGRPFTPTKNSPDKDLVMTPPFVAKNIIDHFNPTGKILDPCRGQGAFYDQYPEYCEKDWCELAEGKNFYDYQKKVNWIITNPPWSEIRKFILHGMIVADNIVYLTTINQYTTKARLRDIRDNHFGIKEFHYVKTPPKESGWPQLGFQLGAVHIQRHWKGDIKLSGDIG